MNASEGRRIAGKRHVSTGRARDEQVHAGDVTRSDAFEPSVRAAWLSFLAGQRYYQERLARLGLNASAVVPQS